MDDYSVRKVKGMFRYASLSTLEFMLAETIRGNGKHREKKIEIIRAEIAKRKAKGE